MANSRNSCPVLKVAYSAIQSASDLARQSPELAALERERPGHGAAELARRVKALHPKASLAGCRRAADQVLAVHLVRERAQEPSASLADRLAAHKRSKVVRAFEATGFRHSRAWEGDYRIGFGAPDARQTTGTGWIDYKSRGNRVGIVSETVAITVPSDWGTRVQPLDTTDGLLLLDAEALPTDGDLGVYRATWARQGRGVSLIVEHGYLAVHHPSGTQYHAPHRDPVRAVRGLRRKLTAQAVPVEERDARRAARAEARRNRQEAALLRLVRRVRAWDLDEIGPVEVTLADSHRAGNCEPGTVAFRDRYLPGRSSATIAEVIEAVGRLDPGHLSGDDLTLARQLGAACLVAIRRDKRARRAAGV